MMAEGYNPGLSYSGIDKEGKSHRGNLMTGTISAFVQKCFAEGWTHLTVVNGAGLEVAGIFGRGKQWFSDVA